ncbi:hypothetical protein [Candidatus Kuenenia sp.]|uniref:hypothetical protein n=1 Tax=Candidatus Kuenenia sp. TaxID=2499824 RepID=UPI003220913A
MAIYESSSLIHWNYFIALESDIARLARFVEFTTKNFDTFSIEIAHLLLAASSEVDVVAKQLCRKLDSSANAEKIGQYRNVIKMHIPSMGTSIVTIPRYGLELIPWSNWQSDETPDWWVGYNKVKHERNSHFEKANLKNVLNAMSGLLLLIIYYYRETAKIERIVPAPAIFMPPKELANISHTMGGDTALFFAK